MLVLCCCTSFSQSIKEFDVIPGADSSFPTNLYTTKDKLYFYAKDSTGQHKLHSLDKNEKITKITDTGAYIDHYLFYRLNQIAEVNGEIFYIASDSAHGSEIWKLDKTGKPQFVIDVNPGRESSLPFYFTPYDNKLFFVAHFDTLHDKELFVYDPVADSLKRLTYFNYVFKPNSLYALNNVMQHNGRIYFSAPETLTGRELYTYDPKLDLYWRLTDIAPGTSSSYPSSLTSHNGILYFAAVTNVSRLFYYDGVNPPAPLPNTVSIPGSGSMNIFKILPVEDSLFFSYYAGSYSAGRMQFALGKYKLKENNYEPNVLPHLGRITGTDDIIFMKNKFYFVGSSFGLSLSSYDFSNTAYITNGQHDYVDELTAFNGRLYFTSNFYNGTGRELYRYYDSATTITNINSSFTTTLYPNPAKDIAHLQFNLAESNTLNITVADMLGCIVYMSEKKLYSIGNHTIHIPASKLPQGTYIYQLKSEQGILGGGQLIKQ